MTMERPYERPPGDPRVHQTRQLVLAAARELLLEEGQDAVTPTRLAALTGISRSTIYRHWNEPAEIIFEATAADTGRTSFAPTGDPAADLTLYLDELRTVLESPHGKLIATQIDRAEHSAETAESLRLIGERRGALIQEMLEHEGDDFDLWHALIVGPVIYRRFMARRDITDDLIDLVVRAYLGTRNSVDEG